MLKHISPQLRDLAVDLFKRHGLNPEDIAPDGSICVHSKRKGIHTTYDYKSLKNVTSDEIYAFETKEANKEEVCTICEKSDCDCDEQYEDWKDSQE